MEKELVALAHYTPICPSQQGKQTQPKSLTLFTNMKHISFRRFKMNTSKVSKLNPKVNSIHQHQAHFHSADLK